MWINKFHLTKTIIKDNKIVVKTKSNLQNKLVERLNPERVSKGRMSSNKRYLTYSKISNLNQMNILKSISY